MPTPPVINSGGVARRRFVRGSDLALIPNTTPPTNPAAGDLWLYPAGTNGELWMFVYDTSDLTTAYKWKFIGGSPVVTFAVGPASLTALPQVGTTGWFWTGAGGGAEFQIPRVGDYSFWASYQGQWQSASPQGSIAVGDASITTVATILGNSRHDSSPTSGAPFVNFATQGWTAGMPSGHHMAVFFSSNVTYLVSNVQLTVLPKRVA